MLLEQETQNRYRLIIISDKIAALDNLIPSQGLIVPKHAKQQVQEFIKKSSNHEIQINSEIGDIEIPSIAGNPQCCIHLFPIGDGLKVNLGVRPFSDQGPFYKAAQGSVSIIASIKTEEGEIKQRANRDFEAERQCAEQLLRHCPALTSQDMGESEWRFEEVEDCLEVLSELENYKNAQLEWPQGQTLKVQQTVSFNNLSMRINGEGNWFEYDGDIELNDGQVLSMSVLLGLLEAGENGRFVKLDNGEFIALTANFKKRLEELKAMSEGNRVFHLGSKVLDDIAEQAHDLRSDSAWKQQVSTLQSMNKHYPKVPRTLQAELRDYQREGYQYLSRLSHWHIGACLADDMGLGKTIQTITLLLEQASKGPALVIAPTSVCFNWIDELTKFAPNLNLYSLHTEDREGCVQGLRKRSILICSYGLLNQVGDLLIEKEWQTVVLDEAQAIKNSQTKRWKCVTQLKANCRIALTGTPIENHLGELWSIFRFLNPGLLGSEKSFQQRFATPIEKNNDLPAKNALKQLVKPYILRRLKSEVLDELPLKTEQTIIIEPSEEEMAFYEALRRQALERISHLEQQDGKKRFSILSEITKLRQACCHSMLIDDSMNLDNSKVKIFLEIIKELIENNHRALVFSQYVRYLDKIKESLDKEGIEYQYIDGQTPAKKRRQSVEAFQAGNGDLFLLSLKAGGTGLNLTAADYVIHLDPWWNPAVEDQASDRAHRIGQQRPVTIYRLIVKNTIEEKIIKMHQEKRDLATDLLSGGDVSGKLTEDELIELIA